MWFSQELRAQVGRTDRICFLEYQGAPRVEPVNGEGERKPQHERKEPEYSDFEGAILGHNSGAV